MNAGVYIHIPFCVRKCLYCDFVSWDNKLSLAKEYTEKVKTEIIARADGRTVDSVFFGGGTPSILPACDIIDILHTVYACFDVTEDAEITLEANPGTVDLASFIALKNAGFNRVSIGVQSLHDAELQALGRIHTGEEARRAVMLVQKAGFSNVNVDVLLAIPKQTEASLCETLTALTDMGVSHISAYSLILEEGTPFYENTPPLPDEDEERRLYWYAKRFLEQKGYKHYEISNFCKGDNACRHNIKYWICAPYFGFGVAAHSFIENVRSSNVRSLEAYLLKDNPVEQTTPISPEEAENERLMLGFRLLDGVSCSVDERIKKLLNQGLICMRDDRCCLTDKGLDFANLVFMEFVE